MRKRKRPQPNCRRPRPRPGKLARAGGQRLRSVKTGALPILNRVLKRLRLEEFLQEYLPPEDRRVKVPAAKALLVLVRNLLVSREPLYGIGAWAAGYAPDLLGLRPQQLEGLHDDGVGRALNGLFRSDEAGFVLAVVRHVVREFAVTLGQLHNDSTTITFHGNYADAAEEGTRGGRSTLAITWGHNKDHRPDLKQLLYILTLSDDGGVPVGIFRGANPPEGAVLSYYVREFTGDGVKITVTDANDNTIANLSGPGTPGINRITWDLRMGKDLLNDYGGEGQKFVRSGEYTLSFSYGKVSQKLKLQVTIAPGIETR